MTYRSRTPVHRQLRGLGQDVTASTSGPLAPINVLRGFPMNTALAASALPPTLAPELPTWENAISGSEVAERGMAPDLPYWQLFVPGVWDLAVQAVTDPGRKVAYGTIRDEAILNRMMVRLVQLWAMNPAEVDNDHGSWMSAKRQIHGLINVEYVMRDDGPFVHALYAYWVRVDADPAEWPGHDNFGPVTDSGNGLHISRGLYEKLRAGQMFMAYPAQGGFFPPSYTHQGFWNGDWMFKGLLAQKLNAMGYLNDAVLNGGVSATPGGAMWNALGNYVSEMLALPLAVLDMYWPNTPKAKDAGPGWAVARGANDDQLLIQSTVLKTLLDGISGRTLAKVGAALDASRAALKDATIRPPLIGLPSDAARPAFRSLKAGTVSNSALFLAASRLKGLIK